MILQTLRLTCMMNRIDDKKNVISLFPFHLLLTASMTEEERGKRQSHEDVVDAFASGSVTATGERIFVPIRKRVKTEPGEETPSQPTPPLSIPLQGNTLSNDEVRLIRLQNRIEVEGGDPVPPIQSFRDIGLPDPILQRLKSKGILVFPWKAIDH